MPTPRETILAGLHARLSALSACVLRGDVLPERVPADGLLILRDGEPGEPEITLSPLRYHYQHRAEIEAVVQGADLDSAFDTLTASVGAAVAADRTLMMLVFNMNETPENRPHSRALYSVTALIMANWAEWRSRGPLGEPSDNDKSSDQGRSCAL